MVADFVDTKRLGLKSLRKGQDLRHTMYFDLKKNLRRERGSQHTMRRDLKRMNYTSRQLENQYKIERHLKMIGPNIELDYSHTIPLD
jgi:hypothetical protein